MAARTVRLHGGGGGRGAGVVEVLLEHKRRVRAERMPQPVAEVGTSIGAWHALACAAQREDVLPDLYRKIERRRDALKFRFGLRQIGYDLSPLIELALEAGLGQGMRVPTYVGVCDLTKLAPPTSPTQLGGHVLVRVDDLSPEQAVVWAARSSCQQPGMLPVLAKARSSEGSQWIDGGWRAVVPPVPDELVESRPGRGPRLADTEILVVACSPMDLAQRTVPLPIERVDDPWEVAGALLDDVVDQNVARDLERLAEYVQLGAAVTVWSPPTLAEVGRTFDLRAETIVRRLEVVGPRARANELVLDARGVLRRRS